MNLANKYTSRCTVLSNYVTCANHKQRKLIWLKKTALLLKVNTIIWISKNQQSQKNPMKCTDSRMNSKYKSPYGCRTNSHCEEIFTSQFKTFDVST